MLRILHANQLSPAERTQLLNRQSMADYAATERVEAIVERVMREGVSAVRALTKEFDGVDLEELLVDPSEIAAAENKLAPELKAAFQQAAENIEDFHRMQRNLLKDSETTIDGARLGFRYTPVDGAGVYVPGGKASYPSSVLMGVIPARIAGVRDIMIITPPAKDGGVDPAVLYCAKLAGATHVLRAGGAQGVAAAACGVIGPRVNVIVGPGNRYVTAAKSLLAARGLVRIDMPAGPSEVIVIADDTANAEFVAADLLSQAEHGDDSPAIVLTTSVEFARAVDAAIVRGVKERTKRQALKQASIENHSFALVFERLDDAFDFANDFAAEHLEICTANPEQDLRKVKSAGSVFLGHYAPVALGDYYSGTNHVLPTGGAALAYSGLGVELFLKRITWQFPTRASLERALRPILLMSEHEGFDQEHGHSVAVRFKN